MPTPLENAERKLAALREEIARVERFIGDYHAFASETESEHAEPIREKEAVETIPRSVDSGDKPRMSRRRGARPDEIAKLVERVIREVGRPMTRGDIVEALERRDVELPSLDKPRYVGTIIWRHKSVFVNVPGNGYWLRGETPNAPGVTSGEPYIDPKEENDSPMVPASLTAIDFFEREIERALGKK